MQPPAAAAGDPPPNDVQLSQSCVADRTKAPSPDIPSISLESDDSMLSELSISDSELSSVGSMSPPPGYMSPISSQSLDDSSVDGSKPSKSRKRGQQEGEEQAAKDGEGPARKKRRSPEPKPRIRQNLDVRIAQNIAEQEAELATLLKLLRKRRKIVVVAGAGISVSAGIPDFRSSTGLFKSLKSEHKLKGSGKSLFDASVYSTDSSTSSFHDMVRSMSSLVNTAKPTPFHRMIERLSNEGRLMRLYTQNVDGIDVSIPSLATEIPLPKKGPWPKSVQLHGGLEKMVCTKCHELSDFQPDLFTGPAPPPCKRCIEADRVRTDHAGKRSHGVGRLRPRMVLYNEHNPDDEAIGSCMATDLRTRPDALIVVGTSMKIPGVRRIVKEMCGVVRSRRDGVTVWMNYDDPPPGKDFEDVWDLVVKGPCDEVARQWSISDLQKKDCSNSDVESAKERAGGISILVPPSPSKRTAQLVTPDATPKQEPVAENRPIPKISLKLKPPKMAHMEASKPLGKGPAGNSRETKKAAKEAGLTAVKQSKAAKQAVASTRRATSSKLKQNMTTTALVSSVVGGIQSHFQVAKSGTKTFTKSKKMSSGKTPKEPLSPANDRVNKPIAVELKDEDTLKQHHIRSDDIPQTPLRVQIPSTDDSMGCSRRSSLNTVSPKSIPRGMENLLV